MPWSDYPWAEIAVGAGGFVAGSLATAWWARGRALLQPASIDRLYSAADLIELPLEARKLLAASVFLPSAPLQRVRSDELKAILDRSEGLAQLLRQSLIDFDQLISGLRQANTPDERNRALQGLLSHFGISSALTTGLVRGEIQFSRSPNGGSHQVLEVVEDEEGGGFRIRWRTFVTKFASGWSDKTVARSRCMPFVQLDFCPSC